MQIAAIGNEALNLFASDTEFARRVAASDSEATLAGIIATARAVIGDADLEGSQVNAADRTRMAAAALLARGWNDAEAATTGLTILAETCADLEKVSGICW